MRRMVRGASRQMIWPALLLALSLIFAGCGDDGGSSTPGGGQDTGGGGDTGVSFCAEPCERTECGVDPCGNDCGQCAAGSECQQGLCVTTCEPQCDGKSCGDDGCGGTCGDCAADQACVAGVCETPCQPECSDKECGDNGCGGSCPPGCGDGMICRDDATCCAPSCAGRACGDDGCGGTCGLCGADETCDDGVCRAVCEPNCDGRQCGDNGCGGTCAPGCSVGQGCVDGVCVDDCVPDCTGLECGDDGCGGTCGTCDAGTCTDGVCVGTCVPDCGGKECGDNGCGDVCGTCGAGEECAGGECLTICEPSCDGVQCGDNGCGGSCGTCGPGDECDASGACVPSCVPRCTDRECGDDGCGGNCGLCGENEQCDGDHCVPLCTPNCDDAECGGNGCGGSCGTCDAGFVCLEQACVAETNLVDWCRFQWPDDVNAAPGDSVAAFARVFEAGITDQTSSGDISASLVVEFGFGPDGTHPADGGWTDWQTAEVNLEWPDDQEPGNDEYMIEFTAPLEAGTYDMAFRATVDGGTNYIYCDLPRGDGRDGSEDGYSPDNAASLWVGCTPNCGDAVCGDDGCGGSCGDCAEGETCEEGACVAPCVPDCTDAACGDDGCGGSCGDCGGGERCEDGACVSVGAGVDWCRFQWPGEVSVDPGASITAYGHFHVAGLTDLTSGPDADAAFAVEVGYGPDGTTPDGWTMWFPATANPDFAGSGSDVNDEYMATFDAPTEGGDWDMAFRATRTGAPNFLFCDVNRGEGADGSADGYAVDDAASLTVITCQPACDGAECGDDGCGGTCGECAEGEFCVEGQCELDCTPECGDAVCGDDGCGGSCGQCAEGETCEEGACVTDGPGVDWCRFQFPSEITVMGGDEVTVYGHIHVAGLTDLTSGPDADPALVVEAGYGPQGTSPDGWGNWFTAAPNADFSGAGSDANDEYVATFTAPAEGGPFDMAFRATRTGEGYLFCDLDRGMGADGSADGYAPADAATLSLGVCTPECGAAECGGDGCGGTCGECADDQTCEEGRCVTVCVPACDGAECGDDGCGGTCGECAEGWSCVEGQCTDSCMPACDGLDCGDDGCGGFCGECGFGLVCQDGLCVDLPEFGWCRYQWPTDTTVAPGETFTSYVRIHVAGLTDRTSATDTSSRLTVAHTVMNDGDDPADGGGATFGWTPAQANAAWTDGEQPDVDEYEVLVTAPATDGSYDMAFSVTLDGSRTMYCDIDAGAGSDGSEDDYQSANAATLTVETVCEPVCGANVCGDDGCGGSCGTCGDGESCVDGACVADCVPSCGANACGDDGCGGSCGTCGDGESCVDGACVADCVPSCGANVCGDDGCGGSCGTCGDGESCVDGACVADCVPSCGANVCGDDGCGGSCGTCGDGESCVEGACVADCVPSCGDAVCGDDGCGGSCGSCGADEACVAGGCRSDQVDWCRFQWPEDVTTTPGGSVDVYAQIHVFGLTNLTSGADPDPALIVEAGVGADGALPTDTWLSWVPATANPDFNGAGSDANDEYTATIVAPMDAGLYDMAVRASLDGGATWLYCDLNRPSGDGSADGYDPANAASLTVE